jgi:hypothetical protein
MRYLGWAATVFLLCLLFMAIEQVNKPHALPFPLFGARWIIRLVIMIIAVCFIFCIRNRE